MAHGHHDKGKEQDLHDDNALLVHLSLQSLFVEQALPELNHEDSHVLAHSGHEPEEDVG